VPREYAVRLPAPNTPENFVKHRTARSLGAAGFLQLGDDLEFFPLRIPFQFLPLRFDREDLVILVLRGLTTIREISVQLRVMMIGFFADLSISF
jgi:hypothetical protein